jgi:hypothetical protein
LTSGNFSNTTSIPSYWDTNRTLWDASYDATIGSPTSSRNALADKLEGNPGIKLFNPADVGNADDNNPLALLRALPSELEMPERIGPTGFPKTFADAN